MLAASEAMRYEEAARMRDQLQALERLSERGRLKDYALMGRLRCQMANAPPTAWPRLLCLSQPPRLIEGFDIAHLWGPMWLLRWCILPMACR